MPFVKELFWFIYKKSSDKANVKDLLNDLHMMNYFHLLTLENF